MKGTKIKQKEAVFGRYLKNNLYFHLLFHYFRVIAVDEDRVGKPSELESLESVRCLHVTRILEIQRLKPVRVQRDADLA